MELNALVVSPVLVGACAGFTAVSSKKIAAAMSDKPIKLARGVVIASILLFG